MVAGACRDSRIGRPASAPGDGRRREGRGPRTVPPDRSDSVARRSRTGSSGLTRKPSTPARRAKKTSARRSSSNSTGMCGRRPPVSSCMRSKATATPPMFWTWESVMTRSGPNSVAAATASSPVRTSRNSVAPSSTAPRTSSRTLFESATRMIRVICPPYRSFEKVANDAEQAFDVVHVAVEATGRARSVPVPPRP